MKHIIGNQNGNALWFILLAVALLAFLTGVISRGSSSVDQTGGVEKARIKASSLLRFAKSVKNTVQEMIMNGVSENDLDFLEISTAHDNINCNDAICEVFNVEGGGISYQSVADILHDSSYNDNWFVSTENRFYQFGCDDLNNGCTELALLAKNIPKSVCLQINKIQKITNTGGNAPQVLDISEEDEYIGTYSVTINPQLIGGTDTINEAPEVQGKSSGCVHEFGAGQDIYHFYQILIAR